MKRLLKKIFPIIFLKRVFLWVNLFKISTLDKILYRKYDPTEDEVILTQQKNPYLELNIKINSFTNDIRNGFERWENTEWFQDQYIVEIKDKVTTIEPIYGWGIIGFNKLIYKSLGFGLAPYVNKPSLNVLFSVKRKQVHFYKVISFRDTGEENYFHFYNDILAKLLLLREYDLLDKNAFFIISEKLWNKSYFQFYLKNSWIGELPWFVQRKEWVSTNHVIFCKPYTHTKRYLKELADLVAPATIHVKPIVTSFKIMITRNSASLRYIENEPEIFAVLSKYGFVKVDTGLLSLEEQINLFAKAKDIVSIHGAGITNIIFCKSNSIRLLEIFHSNEYLPFHYIMLANIFNIEYSAVQGVKGKYWGNGGFYLDPRMIEKYCELTYGY